MVVHRWQYRFQSSLHFDNTQDIREGQGISIYFSPKPFHSFKKLLFSQFTFTKPIPILTICFAVFGIFLGLY
uniref:Nucleosome assembly protein (NAP) family protein n=3 Tax=Neisseria meningitidis TaxID=487 RepID=C6SFJ5_NEIME|nr:nucleosome assembly protein (NAP) family protein [Neisseria meningitidis alpha153]